MTNQNQLIELPFDILVEDTNHLSDGETRIRQKGRVGFKILYADGQEKLVKEPVTQIVELGTDHLTREYHHVINDDSGIESCDVVTESEVEPHDVVTEEAGFPSTDSTNQSDDVIKQILAGIGY